MESMVTWMTRKEYDPNRMGIPAFSFLLNKISAGDNPDFIGGNL